ncbi:alpha/beta fold hydrolase [Marinicella litoralis]|uniref:Pimeloyl-ACP methyl ester carboxylesterase n=1 Tax=Marinicella litoralis TaxID=644220 RepID=A0A4R6XY26_9GAMM|nr:alpha/beta hydrolase [Marinicella litoralis]TDR22623.1 pimeloyl-ACP methyl ester carboxylesterase [Marinicella litoralis]
MDADQWKQRGGFITVNGYEHFYYDSNSNKPALLLLHGYPTCSYDYYKAIPILEDKFRVIVHDHLGFGYSAKPLNYSYSLFEQTDQALLLWQQLNITQAIVLAHDYGTSIATELLARINLHKNLGVKIDSFVLCNGSMHIEMAQLRLIQKLLLNRLTGPIVARLSSRRIFARNIKNIYYNKERVDQSELDALWYMMNCNQGRRVLPKTTQYISQRYQFWHRWIGALKTTDVPIKIIWAKNDPVAVAAMAETLNDEISNSELTLLEGLGHFPMLENPELWSNAVLNALIAA